MVEKDRQAEEDKKRARLEEEEVGRDDSDLEVMTADEKARVVASLEASCSNLMKVRLAIYSCILPQNALMDQLAPHTRHLCSFDGHSEC